MDEWDQLPHHVECILRYHVILTPINLWVHDKKEKRILENCLRAPLGRQGCEILDFQISYDHVHILIKTPTNCCIEEVVRDIKEDVSLQISIEDNQGFHCFIWTHDYHISPLGEKEEFDIDKWHQITEVPRRRKIPNN